jgi:SAM-dependent methyltransferase
MSFKDHDYYSRCAEDYGKFRPTYPLALFEYLASISPARGLAWDCATGNGQAAQGLAGFFESVVATDASPEQIAKAAPHDRIAYVLAAAERAPLPDASADLVIAAQALHWFDLQRFYDEVRRVARPGGVVAAWFYSPPTVSPEVDAAIERLFSGVLGPYWPPKLQKIDEWYTALDFPFDGVAFPKFQLAHDWDLARLCGYFGTWPSSASYREQNGSDPLDQVREELEASWGDPTTARKLVWPLHMRVGRVV